VVTDTFGRPWREGVVDVAIGCAGLAPLVDLRGTRDDRGRALETTVVAHADAVSAASGLVMGKAARVPAALVRGVELSPGGAPPGPARALVRSGADDLFRESPMRSVSAAEPASRFDAGTLDLSAVEEAVRAAARESDGIAIVTATSPAAVRRLERNRPETPGVPASAAIVVCVPADRSSEPSVVLAAGAALGRLTVALRAAGVGWRHAPAVGVAADRVSDALDLRAALRSVSVLMLGPVVAIRTTPATVGAHRRR
jgi:hypothetical protein